MRFKSEFAGLNQKIKTAQKKGFRLNEKLKLTKKNWFKSIKSKHMLSFKIAKTNNAFTFSKILSQKPEYKI